MRRLRSALVALALTGCPAAPPVDEADGVVDIDGRPSDMGPDGAPDATRDAMADATLDAMPDAMPDAVADAMPDAASDAASDAISDAIADAVLDAAIDATPDAIVDAALDPDAAPPDMAPPDAALDEGIPFWDAAPDMAPDQAVDAALDQAVDAAPDMAPFDGPARSDDFEMGPLGDFWGLFNAHLFEREVRDGALWMTPRGRGLWFDRSTGPLVHQPVTGDFRVTARVRARRASAPDQPPEQLVHVGGLMARDPRTPPENYVFIVVGRDVDDLSVETKTTVDGVSTFIGPPWPGGSDAELRICRLGDDFHLYKRPIEGGAWELAESFLRDDLPPTLMVGAIAYTNSADPDLTVGFEEIIFADVQGLADCTAD